VDDVVARLRDLGLEVATGRFGAEMQIDMTADGPVTVLVESEATPS
jgi:D-tyrosyl-tRNA(Tyr) deacylase